MILMTLVRWTGINLLGGLMDTGQMDWYKSAGWFDGHWSDGLV
jgi:hypothetical protein